MNKILASSRAFGGMKLKKVYEICFRYNKIRMFATLERQTMGVNMEAHSCKKTCVITVKTAAQFLKKKMQ